MLVGAGVDQAGALPSFLSLSPAAGEWVGVREPGPASGDPLG
jgi:hypothetical protein